MSKQMFTFPRLSYRLASLILLTPLSLFSGSLHAINCNPHALAGSAVVGHLANTFLGGYNQILGAAGGIHNGISPTPSSIIGPCILDPINGRPPDSRPPVGGPILGRPPGMGWGDPHLVTHDGLAYDFQAAGDYAYIDSDDLTVHGRQVRWIVGNNVSRLNGFAIRFKGTTIVINDPLDSTVIGSEPGLTDIITVNGTDMPIGLGGWIDLDDEGSYVQLFQNHTQIDLKDTAQILLSSLHHTIQVVLDPRLQGAVTGLLGNFDGDPANDLQSATGNRFTINDTDTLYGEFLDGWLREGQASLFNSVFDPAIGGSNIPAAVESLATVEGGVREAAAQRCLDAGVPPGFALHACTYDMVFNGDEQWLSDAAEISADNWTVVPASALVVSQGDTTALDINTTVAAMQPAPGSGVLSVSFEVDRYSLTINPGTERLLQVNEPCSATQAFSMLLEQADETAQEFSLPCNTVVPLPAGESTLSVFSNSGDIGDYGFSLVEPASTEIGVIALDVPVTGSLAANERLIAILPSQSGDRVFIASNQNQNQNCNQRWQLLDSMGIVVKDSRTCIDMGLVMIRDNIPYSLEIQGTMSTTYDFTVLSVGEDSTGETGTNQPFELTVSAPGQNASATFALDTGDRIYVDRQGGVLSGTLVVTDPSSAEVVRSNPASEDVQFQAETNGTYTVTLDPLNDFVGVVSLTLIEVADDSNIEVSRGQQFALSLDTPGQRASASFNAAVGETFTITESGGSIIPRLHPPGNDQGIQIFGARTYTIEVTGVHQIVIGPSDGFTGEVEFSLQ